jgi:hypothetical protein
MRTSNILPHSLDTQQWQLRVIRSAVLSAGNLLKFEGEALISRQPNQGHSITFEFDTSAYRTAEIALPIWVDKDSSVALFVNNELLCATTIQGSSSETPIVYVLRNNVSRQTEATKTSRLRMLILYDRGDGTATIPLESGSGLETLRPVLTERWTLAYAFKPLLFSASAWGCILATAILLLAEIRPLSDKVRYYAVLTVVLAWIGSVSGLPDLAKIPLRPLFRRFYSLTYPNRAARLVLLTVCFVALSLPAGRVVHCLSLRQRYASLIAKALREEGRATETIKQAFVLLPWRKEAQALFEVSAYKARNPGYAYASTHPEFMAPYRKFIADFVKDREVVQSALARHAGSCCKDDGRATSDPLIWVSSLMPEAGQGDDETRNAVNLLSDYRANSAEAELLRLSFQLYLDGRDRTDENGEKALKTASRLLDALGNARSNHIESTFNYQLACDYLASYYAMSCKSTLAYDWFKNEITARDAEQYRFNSGTPLWARPPQKLILPYMFLLHRPINCKEDLRDGEFRYAHRLLCAWGLVCDPPFQNEFDQNLLNNYPVYQQRDAWLKGTLLDKNIKLDQYINQSLEEAWRY